MNLNVTSEGYRKKVYIYWIQRQTFNRFRSNRWSGYWKGELIVDGDLVADDGFSNLTAEVFSEEQTHHGGERYQRNNNLCNCLYTPPHLIC